MQFHQILVSANPGDAITTAAFELRDLLRQVGPSEVYARFIHPHLEGDVLPMRSFASRRTQRLDEDVLLFHASIGEPEVTHFVATRPERLMVVYHNISPWERFLPFDPRKAGLLAAGRLELASLADKTELALTVSEYNAAELRAAGFRRVGVAPLVVDVDRLRHVAPHEPTVNHLQTLGDDPVVLFVGQMLPHKRPELLIEAYHLLVTNLLPRVRLIMVGNHLLPRFSELLEHQINELNLDRAWLTGPVSQQELVAFYRRADAFVTMSEHEGFCVPLLEAMGFDVPVIARGCAAVPETLGDAGVLLPEAEDPVLAAEAMAEVLTSQSLRQSLIERGRARVAGYDPDIARAQLVDHILTAAVA